MISPGSARRFAAALAGLVLASVAAPAAAPPGAFDPTGSDPRAITVADLVMQALGGVRAWGSTRFLYFSFVLERNGRRVFSRTHLWDRRGQRLRYETVDAEGNPYVVLFNLTTGDGQVWRVAQENGAAAPGAPAPLRLDPAAARPLLQEAYTSWINDTYWLLMPFRMKDPGVHLRYAGEESLDGRDYDTIELTFDQPGLTPADRYWAHVDRTTHLMERWSYVLQDDPRGAPPTVWDWKGWTRRGRILLAPEKIMTRPGTIVRILHPILEVFDSLPDVYFTSPAPLPPSLGERPRPATGR